MEGGLVGAFGVPAVSRVDLGSRIVHEAAVIQYQVMADDLAQEQSKKNKCVTPHPAQVRD